MRVAGVLAFVAVVTAGCSSVPWASTPWISPEAAKPGIETRMLSEVQTCQLLDQVTASSQPDDPDTYDGAVNRAKNLAAERSGDVISIRSYQTQSGGAHNGAVTVTANVYACRGVHK